MKVLGMLFIVWGHFTPNIMHNFIYAFNVPLFFCISGALTNVPSGGGGNCGEVYCYHILQWQ